MAYLNSEDIVAKQTKKKRRVGAVIQRPVLQFRVHSDLYEHLKILAREAKITISQEAARRLEQSIRRDEVLKDLRRIDHKKGDRYVLTCEGKLSAQTISEIQETWTKSMGDDYPLVILGDGCRLVAIRSDEDN